MKDQRGSVTVIAIVMLLFLMVIAIAWLPMMTMEKTAASSDYREQQAWYAAEAGYKRAVAALKNKNTDWSWITPEKYLQGSDSMSFIHLSIDGSKVDQKGVWYAVGIMENNVDIDSSYTPEENIDYQITSVGSCQGIRKVIRKTYVLSDTGGSGGGGSGGEEVLELPGLVQAGGKVLVKNSNQVIVGAIYGADKEDQSGNQHFNKGDNWQGNYTGALKTKLPDNIFDKSFYKDIKTLDVLPIGRNDTFIIDEKEQVYIEWPIDFYYNQWDYGNWNYQIQGKQGSVLFINCPKNNNSIYLTDGIIGPSSGEPLTLVFNGDVVIRTPLQGNIRIFAKNSITLSKENAGSVTGNEELLMIMANGNIDMSRPWGSRNGNRYAFLSSNADVILENSCDSFRGQVQAQGDVTIWSEVTEYSNKVLTSPGFTVPKGME